MGELSKRGPHRVMRGDLAIAGQPGIICTPGEGLGLPAVSFGHAWLTPADGYRKLLEHLASWGIVAAAPSTERGPVPSHLSLADDMRTALDICTSVRLGTGAISVHPDRLAFAGHGMGAGAAVIAAQKHDVTALALLFPTKTAPAAETIAPSLDQPALILVDNPEDTEGRTLASVWGGDSAVLRTVEKAQADGLADGKRVTAALGIGKTDGKTQDNVRALLTGFLLYTLNGDKQYADFAAPDSVLPKSLVVDPFAEIEPPKSRMAQISQLLGR